MKSDIRNRFKAKALGVAGAVVLAVSANAQATLVDGIVDIWNVNVSTVFDTTTICDSTNDCSSPAGVTVVNSQSLRWGTDGGSGRSGLDILDSPSNQNVSTNGAAVDNVSVKHLNRPISGTTLKSLDVKSTLTLTPFAPPAAGLPPVTITFGVKYLETPNGDDPCAGGGANGSGVNINGCADIYVTSADSLNFQFAYDLDGPGGSLQNQIYFISFFEATSGLNSLPTAACTAVGAPAPCLGFRTPESQDTTVQFAALITTTPVVINPTGSAPEPASLALLGLGLAGLGFSRRRAKQ